ncbi:hypothetical protein Pst134EA_019284 [Puccinia striiformis f. sp. tritici]|uniref:hypothetical protein n=1 Tax=Puccinia striiformis f. sp. tritici TaxID=168172 RepID=UPI0020081725|nr:hypothetical protein Pst134EA_019284 [Puccinia striiformis f. sp. tritici]KAH9459129.1 hypothetical protein Pst134EA_019284 [Puccinia striiformis f. sp. tritici]
MFSTPTSKAGTLFDLIRSSPTTASSSYQESHENLTKVARSGAPSLQSKSPPQSHPLIPEVVINPLPVRHTPLRL